MSEKMKRQMNRRSLLITTAAIAVPAVGCSTETIDNTISEIDTDTIETASLALRGFAILSCAIGPRVIVLPTPGVRILAVFLIVSGVATKLAIEYLDVELRRRHLTEPLVDDEVKSIESNLSVTFTLENGESEQIPLGANQYEDE